MNSLRENLLCQYRYDGLDRLIGNELPDRPTVQRFYCKSRLATEIQGTTKHSIIQHDDLLLAQRQREGDGIDTTLLATDLQRSVLQTLKANNSRRPLAYSPYGHRPAESGLSSPLGFNGERADPVTGHYLLGNGYRAFNPVLMRFNSPDSWSPFGKGGVNPYAYCSGDPTNKRDPSGHANTYPTLIFAKTKVHSALNRTRARLAIPSRNNGDMIKQIYKVSPQGNISASTVINHGTHTTFSYPSGLTRAVINKRELSLYQSSINVLPGKNIQHALTTPGELPHTLQAKLMPLDRLHEEINYLNHIGASNIKKLQPLDNKFAPKRELILSALNGEVPGLTPKTAKEILYRSGRYNPAISLEAEEFHRNLYEELFNIRN